MGVAQQGKKIKTYHVAQRTRKLMGVALAVETSNKMGVAKKSKAYIADVIIEF